MSSIKIKKSAKKLNAEYLTIIPPKEALKILLELPEEEYKHLWQELDKNFWNAYNEIVAELLDDNLKKRSAIVGD
jgi:hypothetical protein